MQCAKIRSCALRFFKFSGNLPFKQSHFQPSLVTFEIPLTKFLRYLEAEIHLAPPIFWVVLKITSCPAKEAIFSPPNHTSVSRLTHFCLGSKQCSILFLLFFLISIGLFFLCGIQPYTPWSALNKFSLELFCIGRRWKSTCGKQRTRRISFDLSTIASAQRSKHACPPWRASTLWLHGDCNVIRDKGIMPVLVSTGFAHGLLYVPSQQRV